MARKNQYYFIIMKTALLQIMHLCTNVSAATFSQNIRNILRQHDFTKTGASVQNSIHLNTLVQKKNYFRQKTALKFRDDPFGLGIDIDEDLGYKNEAMESLGLSMSGRMNIDDLLQSALDSIQKPKEVVELDGSTRTVKSDLFFADFVIEKEASIDITQQTDTDNHDDKLEDKVSAEIEQERKGRIAAREMEIQKKLLQKKVKSILAEQEKNAIALAERKRMEEAKKLQDAAREEERRKMEKMKQEMERVAAEREKERMKELEKLKLITKSAEKDKKLIADAEKEIKEILAAAKKEDRLIMEASREIKDRLASTVSPDEAKLEKERRISAQKREFEQFFPLKKKQKIKHRSMKNLIANVGAADTKFIDEKSSTKIMDLKSFNITSDEKKVLGSIAISPPEKDNTASSSNSKPTKIAPSPMQIQKGKLGMGSKKGASKEATFPTSKSRQLGGKVEKQSVDALLEKVSAMEKDMEKEIEAFVSRASKAMSSKFSKLVSDQLLNLSNIGNDQTPSIEKPLILETDNTNKEESTTTQSSIELSKGRDKNSRDTALDSKIRKIQLKVEEDKLQRQIEVMKQKKKLKDEELFARTKVLEAKRKRQAEQQKAIATAIAQDEANAIAIAKKEAEQEALQVAKRRAIDMEAAEQARKQAREAEEKLRARSSLTFESPTNFQTEPIQDTTQNKTLMSQWGSLISTYLFKIREMNSQVRETNSRVRIAYKNWCNQYGKISDESRFHIFSANFFDLEEKSKKFGTPFYLNEFADCTEEEYLSRLRVASSEIDSVLREETEKITRETPEINEMISTRVADIETVDFDQEVVVENRHETVRHAEDFVLQNEHVEASDEIGSTFGDVDIAKDNQNELLIPYEPAVQITTSADLSKSEHVRKRHVVSSKSKLFSSFAHCESQIGQINLHRISTLSASIDDGVSIRQHEILCQAKKSAIIASLTVLAHLVTHTHKNILYIKKLNNAYEIKKDLLVAKYMRSNVSSNRALAYLLSVGLLDVHRTSDALPDQETLVRGFKVVSSSMSLLILLSVFEAGACLKMGERLALYSILTNNRLPNITNNEKRLVSADNSNLFSSRSRDNAKLEELIDEFILD